LRDKERRRPVYGGTRKFQEDPNWRDLILFYEYFHGDNGAGLALAPPRPDGKRPPANYLALSGGGETCRNCWSREGPKNANGAIRAPAGARLMVGWTASEQPLNLLSHEGKVRVKCRCERGFALTDRDALKNDLNPASTICISIAATKAPWSAANGRARALSV
jgi:hypothetical protein